MTSEDHGFIPANQIQTGPDVLNMTFEERVAHPKPLLCLDFDGVIHRYSQGYKDGTIYDIPTSGAQDAVRKYLETFDIVVYSARARTYDGRMQMQHWLEEHGFPTLPITCEKPPAFLTLDDRAVTFTGEFPTPETLIGFESWNGIGWKQ